MTMMTPSILRRCWRYSLWITAPLTLLLAIWLHQSWQQFSEYEPRVLPEYNKTLSQIMDYRATSALHQTLQRTNQPEVQNLRGIMQLNLFAQEGDINGLNSHLPQSGKRYIHAQLHANQHITPVRLRYRGSNPLHWRGDKKSLRIKLDAHHQFEGMNFFDLVVPSNPSILEAFLAHQLAKRMGLLTPKVLPVWVNMNGKPAGIYILIEQINEQSLLNQHRMPGDIYAGDVADRDRYQGVDNHLFVHPGLWEKDAHNSDYPEKNRAPLHLLIELIHQQPINYALIRQVVDYPSFARFYLFNQWVLSANVDDHHNWRLYYDHALGRFQPIVWDAEGWKANTQPQPYHHYLDQVLMADPRFVYEVNQALANYQQRDVLPQFISEAKAWLERLRPAVAIDPHFSINLNFYTSKDYQAAAGQLFERLETHLIRYKAPTTDYQPPAPPAPLQWQGEVSISGITHIRQPLSIAPGTQIVLDTNASVLFHYPVTALGSPDQPIVFKARTSTQPFGVVALLDQASDSQFQHCDISGGSHFKTPLIYYTAMLSLHKVNNIQLSHCRIHHNQNSDDLVHAIYSDITINNSQLEHATGDAIDLEIASANITNSLIQHNGAEGIDTMHSQVLLRDSAILFNADKGISNGQNSLMSIENVRIQHNKGALLTKDGSATRVINSHISDNGLVIKNFQKNDHYPEGGFTYIYYSHIANNQRLFKVKKGSRLAISQSHLSPTFHSTKKRITIDSHTHAAEAKPASASNWQRFDDEQHRFHQFDLHRPPQIDTSRRGIAQ